MPHRPVSAFTLIELLIVVAIIAILAAIAVPNFLEAQVRARVARVRADLRSVATALESYATDHNAYPPEGYPDGAPGVGRPADGVLQQLDPEWDAALSLIRLTTPVAYLTSTGALTDPFAAGRGGRDSSREPEATIRAYYYVDYPNFALLHFSLSDDRAFRFTGWGLSSLGPDGLVDGILFVPWQVGTQGAGALPAAARTVYDPTNGTVSKGDLARFGGDLPPLARGVLGENR
jgi:prepilin-type N-terminal cleavage/methylation domain-containing protein